MKYAEVCKGINEVNTNSNSVALSSDGLVMAVTVDQYDPNDGTPKGTAVKTYRRDTIDSEWVLDNTLDNYLENELFGASLALSKNGKVLIVGSTAYRYKDIGVLNNESGTVYTYIRNEITNKWSIVSALKENLDTDAINTHFGNDISISDDGLTLIVSNYINATTSGTPGIIYSYIRKSIYDTHWIKVDAFNVTEVNLYTVSIMYGSIAMSKDGLNLYILTYIPMDSKPNVSRLYVTKCSRLDTTSSWSFNSVYLLKDDTDKDYISNRIAVSNNDLVISTYYYNLTTNSVTYVSNIAIYKQLQNGSYEYNKIDIDVTEPMIDISAIAISENKDVLAMVVTNICDEPYTTINEVVTYKKVN